MSSIPLTNYAGWLLVATLMAAVMEAVNRVVAPRASDDVVPIGLFLWTWLGSALAHAVFLDGPELRFSAVYGFVVMGSVGIPLLWIARRRGSLRSRHAPMATPAD